MQFSLGLVTGLVVGSILLASSRKAAISTAVHTSWPAWAALALGMLAAVTLFAGVAGLIDTPFAVLPAIAIPFAGVVLGVGRVVMGDRGWKSWLGVALASVPVLFWVVFAVAELVGPSH